MSFRRLEVVAMLVALFPVCKGQENVGNVTIVELGMLTHAVYLSSTAGDCSGSIISEEFVLTAAHCLVSITATKLFGRYRTYSMHLVPHDGVTVRAGVVDMMPTDLHHRQETFSTEIIIHPHFRPMKLGGFDIGLIRVKPLFNFTDAVFRVEISEKGWVATENQSTTCQASGFGDMTNTQTARLKMWDVKARHGENTCPCSKRFQWMRLICTSKEEQPKICDGDSGAGLVCEDKIVALTHMVRDRKTCENLGYPKCTKGTLNTYTFLCPINDWIKKYVSLAPPTPATCLAPRVWTIRNCLVVSVMFLFCFSLLKLV